MNRQEKYNELINNPEYTEVKWHRVGYILEKNTILNEFKNIEYIGLDNKNIEHNKIVNIKDEKYNFMKNSGIHGLGKYINKEHEEFYNEANTIIIKDKITEPITISYHSDKNNNVLIDNTTIILEENAEANITIIYDSNDDNHIYHNGFIDIYTKKNAKLKIVTIQLFNTNSKNFMTTNIQADEASFVESYSVQLGSKINLVSEKAYLEGNTADVRITPVYLSDKDHKNDFEYTLDFKGKLCVGHIVAKGATKDTARKVFRGNLKFEQGSTKSVGDESEFSILLDKNIHVDSIPTLFCEEDDVIGAHAASVGKVDDDRLFYLMSRGLDKNQSKKIIVESSFRPVIEAIESDDIKERLFKELDNRI